MAALGARSPIPDATLLRLVLRSEIELGRVELYRGIYVLNGGLPEDVKLALRDLALYP